MKSNTTSQSLIKPKQKTMKQNSTKINIKTVQTQSRHKNPLTTTAREAMVAKT
jgi:hypothetical protein